MILTILLIPLRLKDFLEILIPTEILPHGVVLLLHLVQQSKCALCMMEQITLFIKMAQSLEGALIVVPHKAVAVAPFRH